MTADLQTLRAGPTQPQFKVKLLKDPRGAYSTLRCVVHSVVHLACPLHGLHVSNFLPGRGVNMHGVVS